jgi:ABC-type transport system substrate-binding protein
MTEALGYTKGADGQLRDAQGPLPALEIRANDVDTNTKVMYAIADQWQRLGVKVDPVVIVPERRNDAAWITTFPSFYLNRMPSDLSGLKRMHRNQTPLPENGFRGGNYSRYQGTDLSDLVDRIYVTIPKGQRLDLERQSVRLVTDQLIRMGIFYDVQATLIANRLHGVIAGNSTGGSVANAHQWTVD